MDVDEKYEQVKKGLLPITRDLIIELRRAGHYDVAQELINSFRESCKKQKGVDSFYLTSTINKKRRILRINNKLCTSCGKNPPREKHRLCLDCISKYYTPRPRLKASPLTIFKNKEKRLIK